MAGSSSCASRGPGLALTPGVISAAIGRAAYAYFTRAIEDALAGTVDALTTAAAIQGPVLPDTSFLPWKREHTDAFVCMYHDQGHIPLKALAFDHAVNTTLGMPIIRTSEVGPDGMVCSRA